MTFQPRLNADRAEALDRLGERVTNLPEADRTPYLFLCLGILGSSAPEVLHFVLDRADERTEADPYDRVVFVQGHRHSEPICADPICETYLTREQMGHYPDADEVTRR